MEQYYRLEASQALEKLNVDADKGLSSEEASKRREEFGPNELPRDEGINWFQLITSQFTDLMVIILIIAAVISAFLGETTDVIVILIIVVLNAALGIYQEYQAEQALAALSALQVPQVRVRRNGEVHQLSAENLVPGDIVLLDEGDRVPADGRLVTNVNLRIEEAALTGESVPVDKFVHAVQSDDDLPVGDQANMAFMGTSVTYGRGTLLVTETGLRTEIGKIAGMLLGVEEGETPLQRRLDQLGKVLAGGALLVVAIVFIVGVAVQGIAPQQMFLIAVSLAVAAVPEGLPALVTIGLSLGASRMVNRHALIRRLPAVETLGSVTVICSDKTGTLTKNEMTATFLALPGRDDVNVSGIGYTPKGDFIEEDGDLLDPSNDVAVARFVKAMALSTNAFLEPVDNGSVNIVGDTTEGALLVAARKVGWTREKLEEDMPRIAELPFSSERKAMTTVHKVGGTSANDLFTDMEYVSITKGAPDRLITWATEEHLPSGPRALSDDRRQRWHDEVNEMASQGLRVLGVAYRPLETDPGETLDEEIERELVLLGLVGILDPARPEAKEAVKVAKAAGIRTIMITGDHALTGEAIARDLGILNENEHAITGSQLDKMSDQEITAALKQTSCFARVSPAHKLKLVKLLQENGEIAAMTGDGVNDAPALKQADIGVAMGITGTEVSKGAAEMVLTDDNFASIVSAVEEGRAIYDNIRKFIKYLLSSNVGEILVMFVALLMNLKIPLLAIQILWINLVTDGLPAIALGFESAEEGVMKRRPRPKDESIFAGGIGRHIIVIGLLIAALTLGGYLWGHYQYGMEPFSATLGLEDFTYEELTELVDEALVPESWDSLNEGQRIAILNEEYASLSSADLEPILSDEVALPSDWDSLDEEARMTFFGEGAGADIPLLEHEANDDIVGQAERIPRTIAFTILAFTQMFEVMGIHAGDRISFFRKGFGKNNLLLGAVISTFLLQLAVIYVPFLQNAFHTAPLGGTELLLSLALASLVLVAVEIEKVINRREEDEEQAAFAAAS
ncbi:cation-translocating P-type ATPase [Phototrophicus methaneseepsis]|uniref:Cation-translocating P-type ATPase n=1 Tax=Phototrophicus methaneseepsis TaxID=2710758 RepID=A0A7S8E578_9CHLR|nr:cation-translocating P-type ATPase [Phototrophicus methaneseepsis]QPC80560.1 cation-translocating P-type ATPase [Phototrophicus methaneseepsis]